MGIIVQNGWRSKAIFVTIIIMLLGLFLSRAALSIGIMLFLIPTLFHARIVEQFVRFLRSPYLLGLAILFLLPFISGLWSNDLVEWRRQVSVKLPLLLLAVAFAGEWRLTTQQWSMIAWIFLVLVIGGCAWSLWQYGQEPGLINESYLRAKTIPTALDNDHVRYSWLVAVAALCCSLLIFREKDKFRRAILAIIFLFLVIYIHILSARTGIVMIYLLFAGLLLQLIARRAGVQLILLTLLMVAAIASWWFIPTLQNRFRYNRYDLSLIQDKPMVPGTSDANRWLSIKAGWKILRQHPLGVGAGDVRNKMNDWYNVEVPGIQEKDKLYPSSEWLVYGDMFGWPGVLLFTIIICVPFFIRRRSWSFYWIMLHVMALSTFFFETGLETQFGIFIYCFIGLCLWKWLEVDHSIKRAVN